MVAAPQVHIHGPIAEHLFLPWQEQRWSDFPEAICFHGEAGSGKSLPVLLWCDMVLRDPRFEGVRIGWVRKTRTSITQSSLVTYESKVLRMIGRPRMGGAAKEQRSSYTFPKGRGRVPSEFVFMGLDDPGKVYSAEYDILVYEEARQVTQAAFEEASERALRNGALPFQMAICVTNPDSQLHWIYRMMQSGLMKDVRVPWYSNPGYYAPDPVTGEWRPTEPGARFRSRVLRRYTGLRRRRMALGEWCGGPESAIPSYDATTHHFEAEIVVNAYDPPKVVLMRDHPYLPHEIPLVEMFAAQDWGFVNAGVLTLFGVAVIKGRRRLLVLAHWYHSQMGKEWWAEKHLELWKKYRLSAIYCDWDEENIRHTNGVIENAAERGGDKSPYHAAIAERCSKKVTRDDFSNLEVVRTLFDEDGDLGPHIYLRENSLMHPPDDRLAEGRWPTDGFMELAGLRTKEYDALKDTGLPEERIASGCADHFFDTLAYGGRAFLDNDRRTDWSLNKPETLPGTLEHHQRYSGAGGYDLTPREDWDEL